MLLMLKSVPYLSDGNETSWNESPVCKIRLREKGQPKFIFAIKLIAVEGKDDILY